MLIDWVLIRQNSSGIRYKYNLKCIRKADHFNAISFLPLCLYVIQ